MFQKYFKKAHVAFALYASAFSSFFCPQTLFAAQEAGTLVMVSGSVSVVHEGENKHVAMGHVVLAGDLVQTGPDSFVRILMKDKTLLDLGPSSKIELRKHDLDPATRVRKVDVMLLMGRIWARVTEKFSNESSYNINTANLTIGVRGTEFLVEKTPDNRSVVTVVDGNVVVENGFNGESYNMIALDKRTVDSLGSSTAEKITLADVSKLDSAVEKNAFSPFSNGSSSAEKANSASAVAAAQWITVPSSQQDNQGRSSVPSSNENPAVAFAQADRGAHQPASVASGFNPSEDSNGRVVINQDPASGPASVGVSSTVSVSPSLDLDPAAHYAYVRLRIVFKE